ncbi:MAG: hypothetical protein J6C42_00410 [Clostridia bacterium]|nr:hypothetical protein [Clostridia bacterium]
MIRDLRFQPFFDKVSLSFCPPDNLQSLRFPIRELSPYLTADSAEIAARQAMFRDLLNVRGLYELFAGAGERLAELTGLVKKLGDIADDSNEAMFYSVMELRLFTDTAAYFADGIRSCDANSLTSERLRTFFGTIEALSRDPEYAALKDWLDEVGGKLRRVRSLTLGVNLDAKLDVTEVGLVSINDIPYTTSSVLDRAFRKETIPREYECIASVGIQETGSRTERNNVAFNRAFYDAINQTVRGNFRHLRKYLNQSVQSGVRSLLALGGDIDLLVRAGAYLRRMKEAGLPLTFPEIAEHTRITRLYNPLLIESLPVKRIVPSDVWFDGSHRIYVLTGPNSGGKSVYLLAVGIAQILFQSGMPVPAKSAEMKIYRNIEPHFIEQTKKDSESRLVNESVRLKEILDKVGAETLLLLDETFSSTSAYDARFLAEALLNHLSSCGCHAVYVTHLHELTVRLHEKKQRGEETAIYLLSARVDNGRRTFEIVPYEGGETMSSMARDIVIENGLGFLFGENK